MCGIIGYAVNEVDDKDIDNIRTLFLQTEIRGKHATGISWIKDNEIHTVKEPIGAAEFLKDFDLSQIVDNDEIHMIGHIRYSTSDLRYNQPFSNDRFSIVHNGVLSQDTPDHWPIKTETANDSEMILQLLSQDGPHPLEYFPESSQAVAYLGLLEDGTKMLGGWRNGQRPMWYTYLDQQEYVSRGFVIASTQDILKRSGFEVQHRSFMNVVYGFIEHESFLEEHKTNQKDLQP